MARREIGKEEIKSKGQAKQVLKKKKLKGASRNMIK
jgi:hypothetical protein